VAYKKNIDDTRESPALDIIELLKKKKLTCTVFDPWVERYSRVPSLDDALASAAVVMLATDHDLITDKLTPAALRRAGIRLVVDGKNALDGPALASAGIDYVGIGRSYLT